MAHESTGPFRTLHALRIKGFANAATLADMTSQPVADVEQHLGHLAEAGHAQFRDNRSLWQLTAEGREAHLDQLSEDLHDFDASAALEAHYPEFVEVNVRFKELCGEWQLRDGAPNDHTDADYDAAVVAQLAEMHEQAKPIIDAMGDEIARLAPYSTRLSEAVSKVQAGETMMFTGVMCGSYHDIWMELHEDLILTQDIDRATEGSF